MIYRNPLVLVLGLVVACFGNVFGQDTAVDSSAQASSAVSVPVGGDSVSVGNSTDTGTFTASTPSQTDTTPISALAASPEAMAAVQKQQQQLTQTFVQQMTIAAPEDRDALTKKYRDQLSSLLASVEPPAPTAAQIAQKAAAQAAFVQNLPPADKQAYALMQQRGQIALQMATATPEQRAAFGQQLGDLVAQQEALTAQQMGTPRSPADLAQAQANWITTLPKDDQVVMQAMLDRGQAIQAATQLPPEARDAALQAIFAKPLPTNAVSTTSNSGTISDSTGSNQIPSAPVSSPPTE